MCNTNAMRWQRGGWGFVQVLVLVFCCCSVVFLGFCNKMGKKHINTEKRLKAETSVKTRKRLSKAVTW